MSVYFIKPVGYPGPIKIGVSVDPIDRLAQLQCHSPLWLELIVTVPGDGETERTIQNCFADAHSHGEWFHPIPRLVDAIKKLVAGSELADAVDLSNYRGNARGLTQKATRLRNGTVTGRPRTVRAAA